MAQIRIDLTSEDKASKNVLALRRQINNLNEVVARNAAATAKGTAAERAKTTEINRGIKAQTQLLAIQRNRASIELAQLRQSTGLLAESRKQTDLLARATGGLGTQLAALGFASIATEVTQFAADSVRAGVRVEGFRNSLTALYGDAQVAEGVLNDLRDAAQFPGITFEGAVQGAVRLKTVGVEGDRALRTIKEFGNASALSGGSTDELNRALLGYTQTISRGRVEQDNLNQILEATPLIGAAIRDAFGSIDAEVIQDQLDAAGQSVHDFVDILTNQLAKGARASADSTANAFSNLQNATFELQAAIGDRLTPVVKDAATGFTELLTSVTNFISGTNDATRSVVSYTDALQRAADTAAVIAAIKARIEFLQGEKTALDEASEGRANYFSFRGRETEAGAEYRKITDELKALTTAQGDSAAALTHFRGIQENLIGTARDLTAEISRLETEIGGRTGKSVQGLNRELRENRDALTEVQGEIETTSNAVKALATANTNASEATDKATESTGEATEKTKELAAEVKTLTEIYNDLTASGAVYSELLTLIAASGAGDFFRVARGEIEGYTGGIDTATASVTDHEAELDALRNAGFYDGLADPLEEYVAALDTTSTAAEKALGAITDLGEGVQRSGGDIGAAAENLKDFDNSAELPTATIPRLTSAMREFTDTADDIPRVTAAIEATTRSVDDLLDSIKGLGSGERALDQLETSFFSISDDVVPEVTRDIIDAFVDIAEGDEIPDAFGMLGERIGDTLIDSMSDVLSDQLGGVIEDELSKVTASSLASAGATVGISAAVIAAITTTAIPIIDLINRAINPPEPTDPAEIDRLQREQIFQPGHPLYIPPPEEDPVSQTRTRDIAEDPLSITPSVLPFRRRRDRLADPAPTQIPPGFRYNATTQQIEPIPTIFSEDASGGSGLGAPIAEAEQAQEEVLQSVFRFTSEQSQVLGNLSNNIETAEDAVRLLGEDSTSEDVLAAYQGLGTAETAYYTQQIAFVDEGVGIFSDSALMTAREGFAGDLRGNLFDANQLLVRALDDIGSELVSAFTETSGILAGSALAIQRIPEMAAEAAAQIEEPEPLSNVFRLTGEQRDILEPLENNVRAAETFIDDFITEDSTPEEVRSAYARLTTAEQAVFNQRIMFINGATDITDAARMRAETVLNQVFGADIIDANQKLIDAFEGIGFELVNGLTETSGILTGTALDIQRIPEMAAEAAEQAEPEPLQTVFRSTGEQRDALGVLQGDITNAENRVRLLTEDSSIVEVLLAYTNLSSAETAYYDKQLEFINAGEGIFTDTALETARTRASQMLTDSAFDANRSLVGALEDVGFELVNAFSATSGFLNQTQLAINRIPEIAAEATEQVTEAAEPEPLRNVFRFTGEQRDILEPLENNVRAAETFIRDFITEDSTPEEVRSAYTRLTTAEQAVFDQKLLFINNATGITAEARTRAETVLSQVFGADIIDANQKLIDAFEDIGFELVNGLTETSGILTGTSLAIQRIPEMAAAAAEQAEPEPLRTVFRPTGEQRAILEPLENQVRSAEGFIRDFITEDSTPEEIQAAYTRLTTAEQAVFDQQLLFINGATDITDAARERALGIVEQTFDREIRDANQKLVDAFEDIGVELVNALTFTAGILSGTGLAIQQIPEAVEQETTPQSRSTPSDLAENRVRRARFGLSQATGAEGFESGREELRRSTVAYYDLEDERINGLMLSEMDLQDLREDNQLEREQALYRIDNLQNQFAQNELDREDEITRERVRNATEAAEAFREARQEFADIQLGGARSRDDLNIGLGRNIQDLLREALPEHLAGGTPSADRLASIFQPGTDVGGIVGSDIFNRLFEGIGDPRRGFITEGIEDLLIPFGRGLEDISRDSGRSEADLLSDIASLKNLITNGSQTFRRSLYEHKSDGYVRSDVGTLIQTDWIH